jgi:pimeloyl-ACP methyl ester carboxylesterase
VLACTSWRGFGQVWPRGDFYALTLRARRWRSPVRLGTFFSESFMAEHPDELVWWYEAARDHTVPIQVVMAQLLAAAAFDVSGVLQDIQVPTLVVHGTEDRIIPAYNGHGLAARIRDARLILFKGAGHGMTIERAAEFNGAVASFLGGRLHELPGGALHPVDDSLAAGASRNAGTNADAKASTNAGMSARGTKVWH